jgi:hypothetical protein
MVKGWVESEEMMLDGEGKDCQGDVCSVNAGSEDVGKIAPIERAHIWILQQVPGVIQRDELIEKGRRKTDEDGNKNRAKGKVI